MRFIAFAALAAALWFLWRKFRADSGSLTVKDAATLLGIPQDATPDEIAAAHKRLITKVHPDAGGSAELASKVNRARDVLIRHANSQPDSK
jgi:DnaJ homolog subfamily C member 19